MMRLSARLFLLIILLTLPVGLGARAGEPEESFIATDTKILINIPTRMMRLYHNKEIIFEFPVAVGQNIYKTPQGPRTLRNIVWNPWWIPPASDWAKSSVATPPGPNNPLGPVKMDLGEAIRMHGTNKENTVGTPASHGCMRMYNENAKTLAWWIQSKYSDKTDLALFDTYAQNRDTSFHVALNKQIPVEIVYDLFAVEDGLFKMYPDIYHQAPNKKQAVLDWFERMGVPATDVEEEEIDRLVRETKNIERFVELTQVIPKKFVATLMRSLELELTAQLESDADQQLAVR